MPEIAVHKYCESLRAIHDVGPSRDLAWVNPKAQASTMECFSQR